MAFVLYDESQTNCKQRKIRRSTIQQVLKVVFTNEDCESWRIQRIYLENRIIGTFI